MRRSICPDERYGLIPHKLRKLGSCHFMIETEGLHGSQVIERSVVESMASCGGLKTAAAHEKMLRARAALRQSEARSELLKLVNLGLLLPQSELIKKSDASKEIPRPHSDVEDIGLLTCDRPDSLGRALASLADCEIRNNCARSITIYDDSRDKYNRTRNQQLIAAHSRRTDRPVSYSNRSTRRAFVEELSAMSTIPKPLLRFAFVGQSTDDITTGANRNFVLANMVGRKFLLFDDDIQFRQAGNAIERRRVQFSSVWNPAVTQFYETLDDALSVVTINNEEVLEQHALYLGEDVSHLSDLAMDSDNDSCTPELWTAFINRRGTVRMTQMGVLGDSGHSSPAWIPFECYRQWTKHGCTEEGYQMAKTARCVQRVPPAITVSDSAFCMTFGLGLDHRELLPPFLSAGRNEDGIFAKLLKVVMPDAYTVHLPTALLHQNPDKQHSGPDAIWRDTTNVRLHDILGEIIGPIRFRNDQTSPSQRLQEVGAFLAGYRNFSDQTLTAHMRQLMGDLWSRRIVQYEAMLRHIGQSVPGLSCDIQKTIQWMLVRAADPLFWIPEESLRGSRPLSHVRDTIATFGDLLSVWPLIVSQRLSVGVLTVDPGQS